MASARKCASVPGSTITSRVTLRLPFVALQAISLIILYNVCSASAAQPIHTPRVRGRQESVLESNAEVHQRVQVLAEDSAASEAYSSSFARRVEGTASLEIAHEMVADSEVAQILVLTVKNADGKKRISDLLQTLGRSFDNYNVTPLDGIDARRYSNEEQEMAQGQIPMNDVQRQEWLQTDVGFGPVHQGLSSKEFKSNGALACSLGHHRMWEIAKTAPPGKWTVILEDDARPAAGVSGASLSKLLATVPAGVDEVFLDDRHCNAFGHHEGVLSGNTVNLYAMGSTAYAVTAAGARALLAVPFRYNSDHWLNVPIRSGAIKGFCPSGAAPFNHEYEHSSVINSFLTVDTNVQDA